MEKLLGDTIMPNQDPNGGFEVPKDALSDENKADWERGGLPELITKNDYSRPRNKVVCWDIETYKWEKKSLLIESMVEKATANYVKPDTIEKHKNETLEKLALSPFTGQIILSGFYNGDKFFHYQGDEKDIIKGTLDELVKVLLAGYKLVTKGGKRFDLPYLLTRAAIHNIAPDFPYEYNHLFHPYRNNYHVDLESVFPKMNLGSIAYTMGLADVPGNKGSEIAGMYESGDMKSIIEKNKEDLIQSYEIYRRIKWVNL